MSTSAKSAWKRSVPAPAYPGEGASQPHSLNDIMSSQLIQEIEYRYLEQSGALQDPVNDYGLTEEEQLAAFYAEAGLDSNGMPFAETAAGESTADTDADLALALELQEHENQQNNAELQRRAYQQQLDNQKGHVKVIDGDYYAESETNAARGGVHRADLARLEEENVHHSKDVFRVQQQMQHKQMKKGVSTGARVDRQTYATAEGVLDSRTRLMLFKLIQNGTLDAIHGVVKTGKEASVYCAEKGAAFDKAVPVTNRAHKGEARANGGWNCGRGSQDNMEREFVVLEDDELDLEAEEDQEGEEAGAGSGSAVFNSADATAVKLALSDLPVLDINTRRFVPRGTETACSSSGPANSLDAAVEAARKKMQSLAADVADNGPCTASGASNTVVIKIFRTTLNEFSNRKNYIYGDYRYFFTARDKTLAEREAANDRSVVMDSAAAAAGGSASSSSPAHVISSVPESELGTEFKHIHKKDVISMWCEKEYRNLIRCYMAGMRVPCPYMFRQHVLIMACVPYSPTCGSGDADAGDDTGLPALQLREFFKANPVSAAATARQELQLLRRVLVEVVAAVYTMYQDARLVHGDLSEYNILCSGGHAVLIDFGQAVDVTHPKAAEFLVHDVDTVAVWFEKAVAARIRLLRDCCGADEQAAIDQEAQRVLLKLSGAEIVELVTTPLSVTMSTLEYVAVGKEGDVSSGEDSDEEYEWVQPHREEDSAPVPSVAPGVKLERAASRRETRRERRHLEKQQALERAVEARLELESTLDGLLFKV